MTQDLVWFGCLSICIYVCMVMYTSLVMSVFFLHSGLGMSVAFSCQVVCLSLYYLGLIPCGMITVTAAVVVIGTRSQKQSLIICLALTKAIIWNRLFNQFICYTLCRLDKLGDKIPAFCFLDILFNTVSSRKYLQFSRQQRVYGKRCTDPLR